MKPYLNVTEEVRKKVDAYYAREKYGVFGTNWLFNALKDDNSGRLFSWWHVRKSSPILGASGSVAVRTGARTCVKFFFDRTEASRMRYLSTLPPTRGILRVYDVVWLPVTDRYIARMDRILCTQDQARHAGILEHCQSQVGGVPVQDFIEHAIDAIGMDGYDALSDWHDGNWGYSLDGYPTWIDWECGRIPEEHQRTAWNIPYWDGKQIVRLDVKEKVA